MVGGMRPSTHANTESVSPPTISTVLPGWPLAAVKRPFRILWVSALSRLPTAVVVEAMGWKGRWARRLPSVP